MNLENTRDPSALSGLLDHFMDLLLQEQRALKSLDYALIDSISQRKLGLQQELDQTMHHCQSELSRLEQGKVEHLKSQLTECRKLSQENLQTTQCYQEHIQRICNKLTGAKQQSYGRVKAKGAYHSQSKAILTDTLE